jgi:hypothetical protein
MKLNEVQEEIAKDSKIEITELDSESIKIPELLSKWIFAFTEEAKTYKEYDIRYNILRKEKVEYYLGKADDDVYEKDPLDRKILRQDLEMYLQADTELAALDAKRTVQKLKCDAIEQFVKSLQQRNFIIKNAIDFMRFKNGIN